MKVQHYDVITEIDTFSDEHITTMILYWAADGNGEGKFTVDNTPIQSFDTDNLPDNSCRWQYRNKQLIFPITLAE